MPNLTNPMTASGYGQQQGAPQQQPFQTSPMSRQQMGGYAATGGEAVTAVTSGIATQFWTELIAYPVGDARSLWLQVAGSWRRFDNSPAHWEDMVQRAFAANQKVQVWYDNDKIVGLVVNT